MSRFLVTGASGHLGRHILHHLVETLKVAPGDIVAASRAPDRLAEWAARGVVTRAADFDAPETLAAAFAGVERLVLVSTDALGEPGLRLRQHRAAVAAADAAGVRHIVYTSLPHPDVSPILFAPDHAGTEAAIAASGIAGWTILRNHWYFENIAMTLPTLKATGIWYTAAGDGRIAHIARDDLARAAATALVAPFDGKRTLTLGGSESFGVADLAGLLSGVVGRPITVVQVPPEALVQGMITAGLPEPVARLLASFDAHQAAGLFAEVTGDYKALTGVEPQRFADWLAMNRAALAG